MWTEIAAQISQVTGKPFEVVNRRSVSGGCINQGCALIGDDSTYFVKTNQASQVSMFEAEALGLKRFEFRNPSSMVSLEIRRILS